MKLPEQDTAITRLRWCSSLSRPGATHFVAGYTVSYIHWFWKFFRVTASRDCSMGITQAYTDPNLLPSITTPSITRVAECINACAGIKDPSKAIEAAREALQQAWLFAYALPKDQASFRRLEEAIELLTPKS